MYELLKSLLDPLIFFSGVFISGLLLGSKKSKKRNGRIIVFLSLAFLYLASISPVSNALFYLLEGDYFPQDTETPDKLDVIVVLGGGIKEATYLKGGLPSHQTASRLLYALQVFRKAGSEYLICSGKGFGKISEAEVMGAIAENLGIPRQNIKLDSKSNNTREHAEELNIMLKDKNLRIGLVTSAYHMRRSKNEYRKYFKNLIFLPSDFLYSSSKFSVFTLLPRSDSLYKFFIASREIMGLTWYKIRDILRK